MNAARLVRTWVHLYTSGLPDQVRDDRRAEIESDLWSQLSEKSLSGSNDGRVGIEILVRLVAGIPADLSWRSEQIKLAPATTLADFSPPSGLAIAAVLALFGGLTWVVWPIPVEAIAMSGEWSSGQAIWWIVQMTMVLGTWAIAGAVVFVLLSLQDSIRPFVALIGTIAASLAIIGALGAYPALVALPFGSVVMALELRQLGLLSRRLLWAHVLTSVIAFVPLFLLITNLVSYELINTSAILMLVPPYGLSWIAISLSIRRAASTEGVARTL